MRTGETLNRRLIETQACAIPSHSPVGTAPGALRLSVPQRMSNRTLDPTLSTR